MAHFIATIEKYDYDRQAALYLDVLGATRFLIIGVQKKGGPSGVHEVWRVEVTAMPGLIEQGRKKYNRLLRAHAEQHTIREYRSTGPALPFAQPLLRVVA